MKVSSGSVFKRGNVYWYTIDIDGKRHKKSLHTSSRAEAYQKFSQIKANLEIGVTPSVISSISFSELKKKYLAYAKSTKAKSSVRRDTAILKKMTEYFKQYHVAQINRQMVEEYAQRQREAGMKAATLNREMAVLKHLFKKAGEWGMVKENPAQDIKPLKLQKKPIRYLTDDEIQNILKAAPGIWRSVIITFLETGMRAGELARLEWKDVDIAKKILSVAESKSYKPRYIEISDRLLKVLNSLPKEDKRIFPFGSDYIIHKVAKICEDAKLPDVTCHVFRHTFASRLVSAGVNLRTVQALLGHSSINTTMIYAHLAPDYLKGIGEKLGYRY